MHRHGALRVVALILTVFLLVAPAIAAPRSDSPSSAIQRIILKIKKIFTPVAMEDPSFPHP
jgi:hypothetical protein